MTLPAPTPSELAVVVPVHGAPRWVERSLDRLATVDAGRTFELLVVADGPQDEETEAALARGLEPFRRARLLRARRRAGYAAAVARASTESTGDFVVLNSDCLVTSGWLAKLAACARSRPRVATVTPFTNNGTICSLPIGLAFNDLPEGYDLNRFAARVEEVAAPHWPPLPTGVGFCLYVARDAWRELGGFDAETFGLGYGEEVDFCLRASAAGWVHLLDDRTYVWHEGGASFGDESTRRERRAQRRLHRRHPAFHAELARFLADDPPGAARRRVLAALAPQRTVPTRIAPRRLRILHVVHGWPSEAPGGTEEQARALAVRQARDHQVRVLARTGTTPYSREIVDEGVRVHLHAKRFDQRDPLARNALHDARADRALERLLEVERPDLVHVHHLAGHALDLPRLAARRAIPVVWQINDWWLLCARANLVDATDRACAGPGLAKCSRCLPLTRLPPRPWTNGALYALRRALARRALDAADLFLCASSAVERVLDDLLAADPSRPVRRVPLGIEPGVDLRHETDRPAGAPLRLGYLGAVMPHKGVGDLVDAVAELPADAVRLEIWGDLAAAPAFVADLQRRADPRAVTLRGAFSRAEKDAVLARFDLLVVPSIGLESYGLAAYEALAHGIPVVASRIGALSELPLDAGCGAFFSPGRPAELARLLAELSADRERLARWRERIPPIRTADDHAADVEAIYLELLDRRSRR